jgi:3-hydroxypropanoate dehydrogenase
MGGAYAYNQGMSTRASHEALDVLFRRARTFSTWLDKPVPDDLLREVYDLMKWGPTSMNGSPLRIFFLRTKESKERLRPALAPGNVQKTMAAPVTVIIANDMKFYDKLPKLMPHNPNARSFFENSPEVAEVTARRNATLQGAYFMLAARAVGLDCGPMSGFDNARVDQEFFGAGLEREGVCEEYSPGRLKSNFLCNLGYGDPAGLHPRLPRLDFDEACKLV